MVGSSPSGRVYGCFLWLSYIDALLGAHLAGAAMENYTSAEKNIIRTSWKQQTSSFFSSTGS
jgi:hypothetical protein